MEESRINGKRIAKNTIFLYFRMLLIMGVTLVTSRIVLDKLGTTDYGIYGAVGGVVAMLGFLNGTLSTGTSRFLTFELSRKKNSRLKETFNTAFISHFILSLIVIVILETIGVWFVSHKLIIPPERLSATVWTFHMSVLTIFVSIIQVPYMSAIIAHENLSIYALVGIFEASAKLGIVYLLSIGNWDRLVLYAILVAIVQILVAFFYIYYCVKNYKESHIELKVNNSIFKEMLSFSGWSLLANLSQILSSQGLIVIMNMFFLPVVVAAQTIGNQLASAIMSFVGNFRTAINPQIIKLYAAEAYAESRKLTLETSIYVFELILLFSLPMVVLMEPLLELWLVAVPEYTVAFSQYIVISQLFNVYNNSFYIPMTASGKLKENSYASLLLTLFAFITLYILFKSGWDVMWIQYISIIQVIISSFIIKPVILCKYIPDYSWSLILKNEFQCLKISVLPVIVTLIISRTYDVFTFLDMVIVFISIFAAVCISALMFMQKVIRRRLIVFIVEKVRL